MTTPATPPAPAAVPRYLPDGWPLPQLTDWNHPFFTRGVLTIQHCAPCHQDQHPPLDFCHRCQGDELTYRECTGLGTVDNVSVVHHAADPRLAGSLPYNVVLVEPDDAPGVLVLGNVVDPDWPSRLDIGSRVRAVFAELPDPDTGDLLRIPHWTLLP